MQQKMTPMVGAGSRSYLKDQTILIIEHDLDTQLLLSRIFLRAGGDVVIAENGGAGLRKFFDHMPSLVLLDVMLPDFCGYEVCAMIRKESSVPIIMLAASAQEKDIIQGLDAGANDFLSKPVSQSFLLSRSRAVLHSSLRTHTKEDTGDYPHLWFSL